MGSGATTDVGDVVALADLLFPGTTACIPPRGSRHLFRRWLPLPRVDLRALLSVSVTRESPSELPVSCACFVCLPLGAVIPWHDVICMCHGVRRDAFAQRTVKARSAWPTCLRGASRYVPPYSRQLHGCGVRHGWLSFLAWYIYSSDMLALLPSTSLVVPCRRRWPSRGLPHSCCLAFLNWAELMSTVAA